MTLQSFGFNLKTSLGSEDTEKIKALQQLGLLLGVSKTLPRVIEKTVLNKLQRHFIKEMVDANYYLLCEFAARYDCIEFNLKWAPLSTQNSFIYERFFRSDPWLGDNFQIKRL